MDDLIRELYYLMENLFGSEFLCRPDFRSVDRNFNACLDQVAAVAGYEFHEELYNAIMDYLILEQNQSFLWGLRLGLKLQTL